LISLASPKDIDGIMTFIHHNWKNNHILSRNKSFFKYEHQYKNKLNFIIAKNEDKIEGILGFISTSTKDITNVFTVIWKVEENNANPVLGIQLLNYLKNLKGVKNVLSVGINKNTLQIFEYLNIYTNKLNQYVLINEAIKDFKIATVPKTKIKNIEPKKYLDDFNVRKINDKNELDNFDFLKYKFNIPYKSKDYFIKRYFKHPIYNYDVYAVFKKENINSLYFTRLQPYNNSHVIRIVDFIGEQNTMYSFSKFISKLIISEAFEYADFYCFGIDDNIMKESGFQIVNTQNNELVIPNYFQPFVKKNIPIYFFANTKEVEKIKIFKGDGDQDRPS
tara:strand:- start:29 stop:1030 length:1002 start_codon:yes stop_codon:yes gene_type:complete